MYARTSKAKERGENKLVGKPSVKSSKTAAVFKSNVTARK
ncbi:hypothetical protein CHRON_66 [Chronisvirus chronis]|uniref:Uncharacterized protein n=1 Tax=Klebsiella phage vB_Kpn_Chronis TaxID=2591378 RepID=A0A5B9MWU3_9CAUD|nr:hypothetical protein CHRON_66 [Klebsiella phage vB_Kpn_Chronis]DAP43856.1 MAG TPA: hypothetical protein [Caudoviricetes sp.]